MAIFLISASSGLLSRTSWEKHHLQSWSILIGIQNVSEGIASYREMMAGKTAFKNDPKKAFTEIGIVSVIPIFLGLVGLFYMQCTIEVIASDNPFNI